MSILALWVQDAGMRALKDLDTSLDQFIELMERKDKQDIPIKQQEALGFPGRLTRLAWLAGQWVQGKWSGAAYPLRGHGEGR